MKHLLDTNIVIYYFNGLTVGETIDTILGDSFQISTITKIEFLGWSQFAADLALHIKAKEFISYARLFDLSDVIAERTILLRQQFKTKTPDAIIAATAWVNGLIIVTNNTEDFSRLGVQTLAISLK